MKEKTTKADVAIVVARFQVHALSEAHIELIETVRSNHNKVVIFLGLAPTVGTRNNPLDFESRKQMILGKFPDVNVLYIKDIPDDTIWSKKLDEHITDMLLPNQTAVLYGGRDSFISRYFGKFPTVELESKKYLSGTELRKEISSKVKASGDFRAGVIWAVHNQYPKAVATIDVIIYDERGRFLMVRKPNESLYRFVGGFAQPDNDSYEMDAKREIYEEVGVETGDLRMVGSTKIQDWRFAQEIDKIKTIVFTAKYVFGAPRPADDVCEAKWFDTLTENDIMPEHRIIFKKFVVDLQCEHIVERAKKL